jgi:LDH2 family malate/lactate/ureidoglycolate dehydrogenase
MVAAEQGKPTPLGWSLGDGKPTKDPKAGLGRLGGNDAYNDRGETMLCAVLLQEPPVHLPGTRRQAIAQRSGREGL